jgi:hypothetical protein
MLAQESRGTLSGRVTDESQSVLADASVHVVNVQTGAATDTRTNESGLFTVPFLLPGQYDVTVEHPGFKRLDRKDIQVRVNDNISLGSYGGNTAAANKRYIARASSGPAAHDGIANRFRQRR